MTTILWRTGPSASTTSRLPRPPYTPQRVAEITWLTPRAGGRFGPLLRHNQARESSPGVSASTSRA